MRADTDDIDRAVALLDPARRHATVRVDEERACTDLLEILAGERDVAGPFEGPSPSRRLLRVAVPLAASVAGVGLLVRALLGGTVGDPGPAAPVELTGEPRSATVQSCRDRATDLAGAPDHRAPGEEAIRTAEVALAEARGDIELVVMRPRESGETYLAYCVLERGELTIAGIGGSADDGSPIWTADRSGPPVGSERLVWGELPAGAIAVQVAIVGAEPVDGTVYPGSRVYTAMLPDDVLPFGDVVLTFEDGTTERFGLG